LAAPLPPGSPVRTMWPGGSSQVNILPVVQSQPLWWL